jgi:hypothetical protein
MFDPNRPGDRNSGASPPPLRRDEPPDDEGLKLDLTDYKPWVLQRGRSRPSMLLDLRRYEPKSGLWIGWQLSYPHLQAVEYIGERMLSMDFGTRQFVIEGSGLSELVRYLQQGSVQMILEYSAQVWPHRASGPVISAITKVGPK